MFQKGLLHFRSDQNQSSHSYSDTFGQKGSGPEKRQFRSDKKEADDERQGVDALLRTVLRRFAVALATLRLTGTTSTATLTATSATTSTTALGYSLKLILVGCFYIVAFASIFMLILHINYHVASSIAQEGDQIETQQNTNQRKNASIDPVVVPSDDDDQPLLRIKRDSSVFKEAAAGSTPRSLYYYPPIGSVSSGSETSPARITHNHKLHHQRTKAFNQVNTGRGASVGVRKSNGRAPLSANGYSRAVSRQNNVITSPATSRQLNKVGPVVASSSIWSAALPAAASAIHQVAPTPELRLANYSPNNRGSMKGSGLVTLASSPLAVASQTISLPGDSQWVPILDQPSPVRQHNRAQATVTNQQILAQQTSLQQQQQQQQQLQQLKSQSTQYQQQQSRQRQQQQQQQLKQQQPSQQTQTILGAPTTTVGVSIDATFRTADGNNNYYDYSDRDRPRSWRHQVDPNFYKDRWRTPRYNTIGHENLEARRPNKLYKRVLLCDKTLVSLEYVGNFELDPRPFDSSFDDNIIDLGSSLDSLLSDRSSTSNFTTSQTATATTTQQPTTTKTTIPLVSPSLKIGSVDFSDQLLTARTDPIVASIVSEAEQPAARRSYLSDEDPLVRCDMWDLEKGLKKRKPPMEILRMAVKADFDTVRDAINRCRQLTEKTLPPDDEFRDGIEIMSTDDLVSLFSIKRGLIPGTKWCGLGDQASSYNDLGPKHRIDICCRAHDHCPIRLKPFRNDYGVLNLALYTKSHCDCDADFYRCLREAHSRTADMLGNLYFNVMKLQCMREERMKVCREMKPIALGFERCVKYEDSPVERVFRFTPPPVAY